MEAVAIQYVYQQDEKTGPAEQNDQDILKDRQHKIHPDH